MNFGSCFGVFVAGRQRVPVGDEEIALVLVLQVDPVLERAVVVAEMQLAGGPHAGQNSFGLRMAAHVKRAKYTGRCHCVRHNVDVPLMAMR